MPRQPLPDARPVQNGRFLGVPLSRSITLAALLLATLSACTDIDLAPETLADLDTPLDPDRIQADRQSWDVRLQLRGPTSELIIEAPYLADFLEERQTRADSGAHVYVIDRQHRNDDQKTGQDTAHIEAASLVVDHRDGSVAFAGEVRITGPTIALETDSLRWARDTDSLKIPRQTHVTLTGGELVIGRMSGTTALEQWRAEQVWSSFVVDTDQDSAQHENLTPRRVGIEARRAFLRIRDEGVLATFDTVTSHWQGRKLQCLRATYDGAERRMGFYGSITVSDSTGTMHADTIRLDLGSDRLWATGRVVLTEQDRRIEAQRLNDDETGWQAEGSPVLIEIEGRELQAPLVTHHAVADCLRASGGVRVQEGATRRLQAHSIILRLGTDQLQAEQVRLTASEFSGELRSAFLSSEQGGNAVVLSGQPALLRDADGEDRLTIAADTITLDMTSRRLEGRGAFELTIAEDLRMTADTGQFDAATDSLHLHGATSMHHHRGGAGHLLEADLVHVELHQGRARHVSWPEKVRGRLQDSQQTTWLNAAKGTLQLDSGRLDRLTLSGSPEVTHRGHEADRASRFNANEMILVFDDDGSLRQLEALGAAMALSRIADADGQVAINEVKGARLLIELDAGAVVAVKVLEQIEGRYLPPEQDDKKEGTSR